MATDLEVKKSMFEYLCDKIGMPIPTGGWTMTDIDPGGTPPTDPPTPDIDDLDTQGKQEDHSIDSLARLFADLRYGNPGS